ncbi:hypothetical protein [Hydromonas duriensis]|uniref:Uncharacterized protein n=1 Tax=Hydromonas duriensis TaxID=1527608 RepID=A0A4R6Y836_9BURK|nr:hypothetical protein [Hydromonas duriensis]TDR31545.1 hypothetical protein DFR44_10962 [Hydromonas duriensis]
MKNIFWLGPIVVSFFIFGLAFELSAFYVLGLNALKVLSWKHFLYSGLIHATLSFFPILVLYVFSALRMFFSEALYKSPEETVALLPKFEFRNYVFISKLILLVSLIYLLLVIFEGEIFNSQILGLAYPWMFLFCTVFFVLTLLKSPTGSFMAVFVAFMFAGSFCMSAGGFGLSRSHFIAFAKDGIVRNDFIVLIERKGSVYIATAKEVGVPLLDDVASKVAGF